MYKNKRLLAIIPARGGSKGIKLKNLKKINKISLIGHVSKIVKKIKFIDLSLVSTDHPKIIKEAKKYNLKILFRRPKKLSGDKIGDFSVWSLEVSKTITIGWGGIVEVNNDDLLLTFLSRYKNLHRVSLLSDFRRIFQVWFSLLMMQLKLPGAFLIWYLMYFLTNYIEMY